MREAVASALAELARRDERSAEMAAIALHTLAPEQDLERLHQHAVQRLCWYELPLRFQNSPEDRRLAVGSLGRLFQLLELFRYAGVCSSPRPPPCWTCTNATTTPPWPCTSGSCGNPGWSPPTFPS